MDANEMIRIEGLSKRFGGADGVLALERIDLSVKKGEVFGVIGLSGAGKSTLVRCMNLLERPTSGRVMIDGRELSNLNDAQLRLARRSIGMVFQQFNLLMQSTALDNICFPLKLYGWKAADAKTRARELLQLVGLSDKENAYPAQLSGGQKQRVAIARALASDPKVLLCDEATSALDPTTTRAILSLLKDINKTLGITIVVITHEMRVVEEICTRVAIIDGGLIAEEGSVADIFAHPKTEAAKRLLLPGTDAKPTTPLEGRQLRLVFDGQSAFEPIIAGLALDCGEAVNILFADTKAIEGRMFGHMVVQLPASAASAERISAYLARKGVHFVEVEDYV